MACVKQFALTGILALLFACGDESSNSNSPIQNSESDYIVSVFADLPSCTNKQEGVVAYVKDEKKAYTCKNGDWVLENDKLEQSSSSDSSEKHSEEKNSSNIQNESSSSRAASNELNWNTSKEAYLNPDITYGEMIDSRDKKVYKTVKIGSQVWMAENLNYNDVSKGSNIKSWCYDEDSVKCNLTGRFYTWAMAVGKTEEECGVSKECGDRERLRGVCPSGWHLPSYEDWNTLLSTVGMSSAGTTLKSLSGWYCDVHIDANGTDIYGFSAIPVGFMDSFVRKNQNAGNGAYFWSSSENTKSCAYGMQVGTNMDNSEITENAVKITDVKKDYALSIRCVENDNKKCNEKLTGDCLVGTWTLSSISQKASKEVISDFSAAPGTMEIRDDGTYYYTRSTAGYCQGVDEGEWSFADGVLTFFENKKGDCIEFGKKYTVTPTFEVSGGVITLYLNKVVFQQDERDGLYVGNDTEVFKFLE